LKTQILDYEDCGKPLRGFFVWNKAFSGIRPGVLVFHENMGLTDHERERATRLRGISHPELLPRVLAGLTALSAQPQVDTQRMATLGFCLGGMAALELACFSADWRGVVSFHGGLSGLQLASQDRVKAKVLVCHGALDP
jgi:dienelactone hydrolase